MAGDYVCDTGVYESHHNYRQHRYFASVLDTYYDCRTRSPLVASNPDPFSKRQRLDLVGIEFCADVERATQAALKSPRLFELWMKLVWGEEEIPAQVRNAIIERCSRIYKARKLGPWLYFRKWKKGRHQSREVEDLE